MVNEKTCKNCGQAVDKKAVICTSCGVKIKKPIFKKWWFWVVVSVVIIAIGTSSNTDSNSTNNNVTKSGYEEAPPTITQKKELTEREKMILKVSELFDKDLAFDVGSYVMGDIPKGEYAFIGINSSKYYCEEDAAGNIIDNENFQSFGYVYVHGLGNIETRGVLVSVSAFADLGVNGAKQLYEIINEQPNYTQSGMYKIGVDIPAGIYTVESTGKGYFALLTGPVGNNDIIDNDNFTGRKQISASSGQYLELNRVTISQ